MSAKAAGDVAPLSHLASYRNGSRWNLAKRIYREFSEDRIPTVAGGITFFVLLALFPAISATVSVFGMFGHGVNTMHGLDLISDFLPEGGIKILRVELQRLSQQRPTALNTAFIISFLVALWSASGGYKALVEGLNVAFEVREKRSFIRQTINALIFTVSGIALAAIGVGIGLLVPRLDQNGPALALLSKAVAWPLAFVACALVLAIVYRFGPDRPHPRWRWITWGSAIAAILWMLGTQAFTWYVQNFGSYNRVYGDLGAAVGFLTWIWLSLVILLLGAEINCELERTDPSPEQAGQRL